MSTPFEPLELNRYPPFYWTTIANRWTANSSRVYLKRFGIGVVEWRVLATLGAIGPATSLDAARLAALDPGACSRAVTELHRKGHISPVPGRFLGRSKPFALTAQGTTLFDATGQLARERAGLLMQDLSVEEQAMFLELLRRVYSRLSVLADD